jgi:hypothetical protein
MTEEFEEDLESLGEDRPLSGYAKSIAEQTDEEVQTEHWNRERLSE